VLEQFGVPREEVEWIYRLNFDGSCLDFSPAAETFNLLWKGDEYEEKV